MHHDIFQLTNGIRVLNVPTSSHIAHACVVINAGSRDEKISGLAHFIEHLLFKKTKKRSTNQILNRLENIGADLNAYTTKEYTCIHASFLKPYLERSLELFQDLIFNSVFPEDEMEKEKGIILDEIASYQDQPEEAIYDDFEDFIFKGHNLGRNILGTQESVNAIKRAHIFEFLSQNYHTNEIVVAVLGDYTSLKVHKLVEKLFGQIPKNVSNIQRDQFQIAPIPQQLAIQKPIAQSHVVLGSLAYDMHDQNKVALLLLNNYLGGIGMSAKLNLEIREKHGIAYAIESNYTPFTDTGMFTIYFGTDEEKVKKALSLIYKILNDICDKGLSESQLKLAKQKFIGQIALGEENRIGLLISMAKSLMDFNRIDSLDLVFQKINEVNASQIMEVSRKVLNPENLSSLKFYPQK